MINKKDLTFLLIVIFIMTLRIIYHPSIFPDYTSYQDALYNIKVNGELPAFEFGSYFIFSLILSFFDKVEDALYWLYFYLFLVFIGMIYIISRSKLIDRHGLIYSVAIFGPLLAFVTLRATPAYLFIIISALIFFDKPYLRILLSGVATLFHVTAFIPFFVVLLTIFPQGKNQRVYKFLEILAILCFISNIYFFIAGNSFNAIQVAVFYLQGFEDLKKYSVYADQGLDGKIAHLVFFIANFILYIFYLRYKNLYPSNLRIYVPIMAIIYCLFMVSPVTAFRISIYFIPIIIMITPWNFILKNKSLIVISYAFSLSFFIFSFRGYLS
jgi:hypothetical protein